jgi:hypothetical protein
MYLMGQGKVVRVRKEKTINPELEMMSPKHQVEII